MLPLLYYHYNFQSTKIRYFYRFLQVLWGYTVVYYPDMSPRPKKEKTMEKVNYTLYPEHVQHVRDQSDRLKLGSASAYLRMLIEEDLKRKAKEAEATEKN